MRNGSASASGFPGDSLPEDGSVAYGSGHDASITYLAWIGQGGLSGSILGAEPAGLLANAGYRSRRGAFRRGAIAELAVQILPPATQTTIHHQSARVITATGRDIPDASQYVGSGWSRAAGRGAVAKLTVLILSPATHAACCHEGAGVGVARRNGLDASQYVSSGWRKTVGRGAVAELAVPVSPPTTDAAIRHDGTAVGQRNHRCGPDIGKNVSRRWRSPVGRRAISELAIAIVSPAPKPSSKCHRAGLSCPCPQASDATEHVA
jgi:hypothetical protein